MGKKNLQQCQSGSDFIHYAETHGAQVRNGHGSHKVVYINDTQIVVPCHNKDLGTGLRCKIIKFFQLAGLLVIVLCVVIWMMP